MVQESLQDEIKWLEQKLEAKKQELGAGAEGKHEKELVRDVVKEALALPSPPALPAGGTLPAADPNAKYAAEEKEHSMIIEDLVKDALANGIAHAVKIAGALKNAHLLDDFHDTLADKYYEKLLEARKLKQ